MTTLDTAVAQLVANSTELLQRVDVRRQVWEDMAADVVADATQAAEIAAAASLAHSQTSAEHALEAQAAADRMGPVLAPSGADDAAAMLAIFNGAPGLQALGAGNYVLGSDARPAARDLSLRVDPAATFAGSGKLRLDYQIPYQATPLTSLDLVRRTFGPDYDGFKNVFMRAGYAKSTSTKAAVVAVYGGADAAADTSRVWAGNFVAYANYATATSIGIELNYGVLAAGGEAYGLVLASAGSAGQPQNAIQIQSNIAPAAPVNGIKFNFREGPIPAVTGDAIQLKGPASGPGECERFFAAVNMKATLGEFDLPSFAVEATQDNTVNRVRIRGAATTQNPQIKGTGTDTNVGLDIKAQGAGRVSLVDGNTVAKFCVSSNGIGFYGATPQAKPTITGSRGGNAALASLLTQLAALGLITDSTTA